MDTEILQLMQADTIALIPESHSSALNGIENLRGMETEHRHIAVISNSDPFVFHTESMGAVVNHFQSMSVSNLLDCLHVAYISIYMDRHDCCCFICDQTFNFAYIHRVIIRADITKYRHQSIPSYGMCG